MMMDQDSADSLRDLLDQRSVAALATLHRGEPAASMVPFVLARGEAVFWLHVSALSTHTRDMHEHTRVSLLVMAREADVSSEGAQALARVSLQADARFLRPDDPAHGAARAHYLERFPQAEPTFALADFSLVELSPVSARLIAGFGRAYSLAGAALQGWLRRG